MDTDCCGHVRVQCLCQREPADIFYDGYQPYSEAQYCLQLQDATFLPLPYLPFGEHDFGTPRCCLHHDACILPFPVRQGPIPIKQANIRLPHLPPDAMNELRWWHQAMVMR